MIAASDLSRLERGLLRRTPAGGDDWRRRFGFGGELFADPMPAHDADGAAR